MTRFSIADAWIEKVREASDIVEIVDAAVDLRPYGRIFLGVCPFHRGDDASFEVHAERQFYHCGICDSGGDVFQFVREMERLGFLDAVKFLSICADIPIPAEMERGGEVTTGDQGVSGKC